MSDLKTAKGTPLKTLKSVD